VASNAFENCSSLQSVSIPEGVTSIGSFTFYGCSGLTSVSIPESVTNVGSLAFSNCRNLKTVYFEGLAPQMGTSVFLGCPSDMQIFYNTYPPAPSPSEDKMPSDLSSEALWADPVNTDTGAHKISNDVLDVKGAQDLSFNISYDSTKLSMGKMGRGCYNQYETHL
ncbi:leucine-rich repeat domain-containing protein, partial [Clostridium akagii]|uniref:leucine-rich repeat domain-containing protein n=1 Tax=Clostridium akagii TaxID=91623 RepID=UPI00047A9C0E